MSTLVEIPVFVKGGEFCVRLLGRPHTVDVIAVSIPDTLPTTEEKKTKWIEEIGNHMLAILRLTHNVEADVVRIDDGFLNACTETESPIPQYPLLYGSHVQQDHIAYVDNIARVFALTIYQDIAPIMNLLAESQTPSIPTHYKILSLIRALELLVPDDNEREEHLASYEGRFRELNISDKLFKNALPALRTRCAHGVSRGRVPPIPFVSQAYSQEKSLVDLLQLLRNVVRDKLETQLPAGLQFSIFEDDKQRRISNAPIP